MSSVTALKSATDSTTDTIVENAEDVCDWVSDTMGPPIAVLPENETLLTLRDELLTVSLNVIVNSAEVRLRSNDNKFGAELSAVKVAT